MKKSVLTKEQKSEISKIAQEFSEPFKSTIGEINGSGWLIVDPLSGFLQFSGYDHKVFELPACENHPQILILKFPDGSEFVPAGADLKKIFPEATNWLWL